MPSPTFTHENTAVNTFVNLILNENNNITNRAELIIMSGIALNNIELVDYACQIQPTIVNVLIADSTINAINAVFLPALGIKFGDDHLPNNENIIPQNNHANIINSCNTVPQ